MPIVRLDASKSALLVVDVQPSFLKGIDEAQRVVDRAVFLSKVAILKGVPVLATEQYPSKMGHSHEDLLPLIGKPTPKMSFSCWQNPEFRAALEATGKLQVVIVGIETHICVFQTAQDLIMEGFEVVVCPDGVSAGNLERHKLGMERIRDAGIVPAHTEAVAYEWQRSADQPGFKELLSFVKEGRQS